MALSEFNVTSDFSNDTNFSTKESQSLALLVADPDDRDESDLRTAGVVERHSCARL